MLHQKFWYMHQGHALEDWFFKTLAPGFTTLREWVDRERGGSDADYLFLTRIFKEESISRRKRASLKDRFDIDLDRAISITQKNSTGNITTLTGENISNTQTQDTSRTLSALEKTIKELEEENARLRNRVERLTDALLDK